MNWDGVYDQDDNSIPCTDENKIKLMRGSVQFSSFVGNCIEKLTEDSSAYEEELEKRKKMTRDEQNKLRDLERKKAKDKLKKMEKAGILGVISSAEVPIRATYNRDLKEWKSWDDLPTTCDIKLDVHQFAEIKQMIIERQRVELEFDIRNYS